MKKEVRHGIMIILAMAIFCLGALWYHVAFIDKNNTVLILEAAPDPIRKGYQVSYIENEELKYYYPITENGKNNFLKWLGSK